MDVQKTEFEKGVYCFTLPNPFIDGFRGPVVMSIYRRGIFFLQPWIQLDTILLLLRANPTQK